MLPVANTIAALLTRNSKTKFNEDLAVNIYIASVKIPPRDPKMAGAKNRMRQSM
jgi:hypothetical protein